MKCKRPTCSREDGRKNTWFCHVHYEAFRKDREAKGGRLVGCTSPQPALEHVNKLRAAGLGYRRIAELAGLTPQSVQRLGRNKQIFLDTEQKLLSLPIPVGIHRIAADKCLISPVGTERRLKALVRFGYDHRFLAQELGVSDNAVGKWINGRQETVTAKQAKGVEKLFNRLESTPGSNLRARNRGAKMGWPPPYSWDANIDDPNAKPDLGEKPDFFEFIQDGRSLGRDDHALAQIWGIKVESLRERIRRGKAA